MKGFVGRQRELESLTRHLDWVRAQRSDLVGRALLLRGRRRVGKSRLVTVFCQQTGVPYVVHQATRGVSPAQEIARFVQSLQASCLPIQDAFADATFSTWDGVLRQLAFALPDDQPTIVVIDELPWLLEADSTAEGTLQTVWDMALAHKPVLLILIGSDLAMMEHLSTYGRPFYQRGVEMILPPLNPYEVSTMTELPPAEAFDAYLLTGGLPLLCQEWLPGWDRKTYLRHCLNEPTSPLLVSGERTLAAEFPTSLQARNVLSVIGSGEKTFSGISNVVGTETSPLPAGSLSPILHTLIDKRIIAADTPLSTKPHARDRRYRVTDPYLRFWLSFLEQGIPEVERGRGDLLLKSIENSWASWRGPAIEPVIREALMRLLPDETWPHVREVGGWWNRINNPEIDLVGADKAPADTISFVGSIKWRDKKPFSDRDLAALARESASIPGVTADTPLIAVSRSGFTVNDMAAAYTPEMLLNAWG